MTARHDQAKSSNRTLTAELERLKQQLSTCQGQLLKQTEPKSRSYFLHRFSILHVHCPE